MLRDVNGIDSSVQRAVATRAKAELHVVLCGIYPIMVCTDISLE